MVAGLVAFASSSAQISCRRPVAWSITTIGAPLRFRSRQVLSARPRRVFDIAAELSRPGTCTTIAEPGLKPSAASYGATFICDAAGVGRHRRLREVYAQAGDRLAVRDREAVVGKREQARRRRVRLAVCAGPRRGARRRRAPPRRLPERPRRSPPRASPTSCTTIEHRRSYPLSRFELRHRGGAPTSRPPYRPPAMFDEHETSVLRASSVTPRPCSAAGSPAGWCCCSPSRAERRSRTCYYAQPLLHTLAQAFSVSHGHRRAADNDHPDRLCARPGAAGPQRRSARAPPV